MITSAILIAKARKEAMFGPDAGSALAKIAMELAVEYEIAVAMAVSLERLIHDQIKAVE